MRIILALILALVLALSGPLLLHGQTGVLQSSAILPLEQIHTQSELNTTLLALDTALFDAYNRCDLSRFSSLVADDVEFYHDQGGLTLGNAALTESVRKNICGHVTRQLTPGTLKVYPMKGLGAVEIGTHHFFENGNSAASGEAEFTMLWLYKDGAWKLSRVFSYDHHALAR